MKKLFALLLPALLLLCLGACGSEPEDTVFQGQTLLDTDQCRFHVASISEYDPSGCLLEVELENRLDTDMLFSVSSASVNGCMIDPQLSESVGAGQTLQSQMVFGLQQLEDYGIDQVTEIQFTLSIYDEQSYEQTLLEEVYTLYPHGKKAVKYQEREALDTDIVLMDNEYCSVIVTGKDPDSFWGYDLYVYLLNKTDKTLMFSADAVTVNAAPCDPYWAATVAPGKCSNTVVYWFDTTLEDAGITQVQEISMTLSMMDLAAWPDGTLASQTVTFTP